MTDLRKLAHEEATKLLDDFCLPHACRQPSMKYRIRHPALYAGGNHGGARVSLRTDASIIAVV